MGKAARTASQEKRKAAKRARKEAMTRQYEAWAAQGINQKSGRAFTASKGKRKVRLRKPNKQNVGCLVSHPELNMPALVRDKLAQLAGYKHQWSSRYGRLVSAFIRSNYSSLPEAWAAHGIIPIRSDIPKSYRAHCWAGT